jgi:predicted double-glycine peptidase
VRQRKHTRLVCRLIIVATDLVPTREACLGATAIDPLHPPGSVSLARREWGGRCAPLTHRLFGKTGGTGVCFAQALFVALALATAGRSDPAGLEVGGGRSADSTGPPRAARSDGLLEKQFACGPNVLYLLLRMYDRPVTLQKVRAAIPIGPKGTNLLELHHAASRLGLATRVRWCTIDNLDRCPLPLIAHFRPNGGLADAEKSPTDPLDGTGHFVFVLEITADRVKFIDGTHGRIVVFRRERFPAFWSGYMLEVAPPRGGWLAAAVAAAWACFALAAFVRVRRATRGRPQLAVVVALIVLGCAGAANGGPLGKGDEGTWRQPDHDGVNCLYLQIKALGVPVRFEALEDRLRRGRDHDPNTLLDLKRAAQACGARLAIRTCGPRELAALPMPAIVLLEELRGDKEFALIYRMDDRGCGLVEGSTAALTEMSIDDFRRRWSGLALVPDLTPRPGTKEVVLGLVAIGTYWFFRVRRPANRGSVPTPRTGPLAQAP